MNRISIATTLPLPRRRSLAAMAAFALGAWLLGPATPAAAADANPRVRIETSLGGFTIEIRPDKAPKSSANFLEYVNSNFYDGTVFHRVIRGFMIQGGGMTPDLVQKPTRGPIPIESNNGLKNVRGAVSMARTGNPNSATSQFFVNVVDNAFLDYPGRDGFGYTVFGSVVEGMDVVDKIRSVETGPKNMFDDVPKEAIAIKSARVLK
jgi:peptidyl-prolyl cis-trans isomerase A (cyclophilin A)